MRPLRFFYVALLLLLAACAHPAPVTSPAGTAQSRAMPGAPDAACRGSDPAFAEKAEALIGTGIDDQRASFAQDAPALRPDPELTRIARARSCDMAHGADFSHNDAEGHFIAGDMVREDFGNLGAVGENIMRMGNDTLAMIGASRPFGPEEFARVAVEGWMKSPGHRAQILDPHYDSSGVGVAIVDGQAFATQVFRGPPSNRKDFN